MDAVLVDDDHFAGFDIADEGGADEVEGAGFGGQDQLVVEAAEGEGAEAEGIPNADELIERHDDEGIGRLRSGGGR